LEAKARIGYLPESNALYDEMIVAEYLDFLGRLRMMDTDLLQSQKKDVVGLCGLEDVYGRKVGELSRGFKQRVGLAQAIIHDPEILVMDEPTTGLDPNQVVEIRELIRRLGEQKTVIVSTHILSEVEATCDRVVIISKGRIVADGSKDQMHQMVAGQEMIEVELDSRGEDAISSIREVPGVETVDQIRQEAGKITYEVRVSGGEDVRPQLFSLASSKGWTLFELHR
jgi:ABC-2 type transport system ATP-binding protein